MLGGDDDCVDALRPGAHIFDADLGFTVGTQEVQLTGTAHVTKTACQLVSHHDRQRHQLLRLVARIPEHQTLIARPAGVYAHRDIRRLRLNDVQHAARLRIEAVRGVRETDITDDVTRECGDVYV